MTFRALKIYISPANFEALSTFGGGPLEPPLWRSMRSKFIFAYEIGSIINSRRGAPDQPLRPSVSSILYFPRKFEALPTFGGVAGATIAAIRALKINVFLRNFVHY